MTALLSLHAVLAPEAYARRRAVEGLGAHDLGDAAVAYALRRLLASDADVAVRALAAGALGSLRSALAMVDPAPWLVAALSDVSPVVRDAAIRALAKHGAAAAYPKLCEISRTDTTWWVRRAALYALGVIAGVAPESDVIGPARAALTDPFWRVRHAAVQVLAVSGAREPDRRDEILADVPAASGEYLAALWGPTLVGDSPREPIPSRLPDALLDRDPAVVTARLQTMDAPPTLAIVELLSDPHVPLREIAALRLIEADDAEAFAAALHWLDEPRIPHVAATVVAMLDALGDSARALVQRVLASPARPGASRWAIGWVVATRDRELADSAWQRALELGEPALALPFAPAAALIELLSGGAGPAIAAADELLMRPAQVRSEVLAAIPRHASGSVRMRLVAAANGISDAMSCAVTDDDPLARATALSMLGSRASADLRRAALVDRDPAVREALIAHATLDEIAALLEGERDPWVRRAAARSVRPLLRRADAPAGSRVVLALTSDPDPWIRALVLDALDPHDTAHLARIVALAADPAPMVQAAILDKLATITDEQLLAATSEDTTAIAAWVAAGDVDPIPPAHATVETSRLPRTEIASTPPASITRRTFGSSGVSAAPLAISGAFDLQPGSLRAAADRGVDLFFWEPAYAGMSRFLRAKRERQRSQVVTGTYHADAPSITKDVDRALRRLRRDALDVFLLFWARSDARLDEAAFEAMAALKRAGKVRAIGFSTHDRSLAMRALDRSPWDVVMTRHSAAHPGIETAMLAHARAKGAGVLTFSALCYGRMISGEGAPSATDCYRYSLGQDGVTACISAPRRHRELLENLEVLAAPALADDDVASMRAHGANVRVESQRFNALIRQPTRDAAAAAMAMLEAELAPVEGDRDAACVTTEALQRSLSSRGRGRASLPSAMLRRGRL